MKVSKMYCTGIALGVMGYLLLMTPVARIVYGLVCLLLVLIGILFVAFSKENLKYKLIPILALVAIYFLWGVIAYLGRQ